MHKVITGSLNGNAYQFEEQAFAAVQAYLDKAAAQAAGNPDATEMLADLEQAIADKCDTFLGKHRNVVSLEQARQILREMGPVEVEEPDPVTASTPPRGAPSADGRPTPQACRRLYRIPSEGMLGGVCAGLAAYVGIDVVWMRLIYILLAFATGVWFFVWLVQLWVTPKATTPEQIAAAQGLQGTAFGHYT
jgi:phage shock protein PspC (stress-responsive transcriptional regulator)